MRFDDECILQKVEGFCLFLPDGRTTRVQAPGYILDRSRFDKTLAIYALESGADLVNGTVVEVSGKRVRFRRGGREAEVEGQVIIGADGPRSAVGRSIGTANAEFLVTVQAEVGLRIPFTTAEIWFDSRCVGGYKWIFPSGRTARVGIGLSAPRANMLRGLLNDFLDNLAEEGRIYRRSILSYSGGPVPVGGPLDPLQSGNSILVGDAAGCADPVTGAGIGPAILSGTLAGRIADEALSDQDIRHLIQYRKTLERVLPFRQMAYKKAHAERLRASENFEGLAETAWGARDYQFEGNEI